MNKWTSLHVFYHNVQKFDEFILEMSQLLAQFRKDGKIEKWFFIRYWEGGPHIRIRILNGSEKLIEEIKETAYQFIDKNPSVQSITRDEYYKDNKFDGKPVDVNTLSWYEDGQIVEIPYEQELQRYGGEAVMELSETIFCYSSYIVKSILESVGNDFNKKLIFAEALSWIEVEEFRKIYGKENVNEFLKIYCENWKSFLYHTENEKQIQYFFRTNIKALYSAVRILQDNAEFQSMLGLIKDEIKKIADVLQNKDYMDYIIASHIHMTNNRLGAAPIFEFYIAENLMMQGKEEKKDVRS